MSTENPDNSPEDQRLKKMISADAVLESLMGREKGSVVMQYVKSRASDIRKLLAHGLSAQRIAAMLAEPLGVRPATVFAALSAAGLVQKKRAEKMRENHSQDSKGNSAQKAAPSIAADTSAATATAKPASNARERIADLPPWADGSDQEPDESDEEYRVRKIIEGPPEASQKAIGESPAERAEDIIKSGKLDFGPSGATESDRKTLIDLIKRYGANTVERRIERERKAMPPGSKLYPSTLRARMLGESPHA